MIGLKHLSRSQERKLERKRCRYGHFLWKAANIKICDEVTKNIVIPNVDFRKGIDEKEIYEVFHHYGEIEKITQLVNTSCSFVVFKTTQESYEAYNALHFTKIWEHLNGPVYLYFCDNIPPEDNVEKEFSSNPNGLILLKNFISSKEEEMLLKLMQFDNKKLLKNREVKHFGYEFKYDINNVDPDEPIEPLPEETHFLWKRLSEMAALHSKDNDFDFNFTPDQLTVNFYNPGQGIPIHVDTHSAFTDGILSLSLGSDVVMKFVKENQISKVILPKRSLCIMSGESRYAWQHGISQRYYDMIPSNGGGVAVLKRHPRISFTFRKLRRMECNCEYHSLCDSFKLKSESETAGKMNK